MKIKGCVSMIVLAVLATVSLAQHQNARNTSDRAFNYWVHSSKFLKETAAVNPSLKEISEHAETVSRRYEIPAEILKGVMFLGSGWKQFEVTGEPLISPRSRIGIMQVTVEQVGAQSQTMKLGRIGSDSLSSLFSESIEVDINRLRTDWQYNLDIGARLLFQKKLESQVASIDSTINENWEEALAYYDGFEAGRINDPGNEKYSRHVERNSDWLDTETFPYQEAVLNIVTGRFNLPKEFRPYFDSASTMSVAVASSPAGWASQTGFRNAGTPLQRAIVAAARSAVRQSSGPSTTNGSWLTDTADRDGTRMRAATSRYQSWYWSRPRRITLDQVKSQMKGDFAGSAYDNQRKQALVNRIVERYNYAVSRGPFMIPSSDNDTLSFLGIRKQCLEWAMTTAIAVGGGSRNYSASEVTNPSSFRPGMGLYRRNRSHAMIIVDIKWDSAGNAVQFQVVESNYGSGWVNPPGMVPWERSVGTRSTETLAGNKVVSY